MEEVWKDVKDFEGIYQVSNLGNVRSLDRIVFNKGNNSLCNVKGKILKPNTDKGGYKYVGLYSKNNTRISSVKVHRLVAIAFCEGYCDGLEVNHINGIRSDNRSENLEWVTKSGNAIHRFKLGYRIPKGDNSYTSVLKEEYYPLITSLYDLGVNQHIIAKAFNVSQGTISNFINGKHYNSAAIEKGLAISTDTLGKEVNREQ